MTGEIQAEEKEKREKVVVKEVELIKLPTSIFQGKKDLCICLV